jgi:hypothetical protein
VSAALLSILVACGFDPESSDRDSDSRPPTSGSSTTTDGSPVDQPAAQKALRKAVASIVNEPITTFQFETILFDEPWIAIDGVAEARVGGWRATVRFTEPGSSPGSADLMKARSADGSVWMQMRGWPPPQRGCWLLLPDGNAPLGIQGLAPLEPTYISIVAHLHTLGFADASHASLAGTLDLDAAASLLQAQLLEKIEISQSQLSRGEAPVDIGLDDQRISEVAVSGTGMLKAIEAAGGTVTGLSVDALRASRFTVRYPSNQLPAKISAPRANLVMEMGDSGCR